ncbi:GerAB/ArcD/ProY family transporter [Paenibacillus radicis (ex Xue et al. 2023)]|uniref:Spore germination protein n=1 Tax=Paenibacillus radicis (ex Xue et al. 2023) TaxID=2972489 RepID=A0ABT1YMR3_9BACL|nr:spore germination protein [Paenibacillus radicis (ex Xue et al. 2023)]MCR8634317.1 spore germination protein [Paenibacillus radicis (ex Xue et al. 2023)]
MDRGRISCLQLAFLMFQCLLGSSVLLMPAITTSLSGRDMWMTPIVASVGGYFIVWLAVRLYRISPQGSIQKLLELVFGKLLGKTFGLLFLLFQIHILSIVIRDYSDFILSNFFFKTPLLLITGSMVLLCAWVVREGVEVLARCSQIFLPVGLLFTLLTFVFLIPELTPNKILPVFEQGMMPLLKGSIVVEGWFCQFMLVIYFLPRIKDEKKILKWGVLSVTGVGVMMLAVNSFVFMLLGDSSSYYNYPVFMAARYISLADFFEHVEATLMMVWVLAAFIKISVFYYAISIGFTECLGLKSYKVIVLPIGLLVMVTSFWSARDFQILASFVSTTGTIYILVGYMVFPCLVYIAASIKKRLFAHLF